MNSERFDLLSFSYFIPTYFVLGTVAVGFKPSVLLTFSYVMEKLTIFPA